MSDGVELATAEAVDAWLISAGMNLSASPVQPDHPDHARLSVRVVNPVRVDRPPQENAAGFPVRVVNPVKVDIALGGTGVSEKRMVLDTPIQVSGIEDISQSKARISRGFCEHFLLDYPN